MLGGNCGTEEEKRKRQSKLFTLMVTFVKVSFWVGTGTLSTSNKLVGSVKETSAPLWRDVLHLSVWGCTRNLACPLLILGMSETSPLSVWRWEGEHEGWEQRESDLLLSTLGRAGGFLAHPKG